MKPEAYHTVLREMEKTKKPSNNLIEIFEKGYSFNQDKKMYQFQIKQIEKSESINTLRDIYNKYPEYRVQLNMMFKEQKRLLESESQFNNVSLNVG